jgi:hypothetical protein
MTVVLAQDAAVTSIWFDKSTLRGKDFPAETIASCVAGCAPVLRMRLPFRAAKLLLGVEQINRVLQIKPV